MRSDHGPNGQASGSFTERARREQITSGAIAVLAADGYHGTSLAGIAASLGISKGVISYHFAGKAELLQEVVRAVLAQAAAWMTPRVEGAPSYREALRRYVAANLGFLDAHRAEAAALSEVLGNARAIAGVPEVYEEASRSALAAVEALFSGGQAAGEFRQFSAHAYAVSLRASIDAITALLHTEPAFDVEAYGRELTSLFELGTAA